MAIIDWVRDIAALMPSLLAGLGVSLLVIAAAAVLGAAAGAGIGWLRLHGRGFGRTLADGWITLMRAAPVLVVMVLLQFALPAVVAAVLALALAFSGLVAAALRYGIGTVPAGQLHAAQMLGVADGIIERDIVLPQALRASLPGQAAALVQLGRDSALVAALAVPDLLGRARDAARLADDPTPLLMAAAIYLAVLIPVQRLADRLAAEAAR